MPAAYLANILGVANLFIALFVCTYASFFLMATKSHKERRPWDLLLIAAMTYLIFQVLNNFLIWDVLTIRGVDIQVLSRIFEFLFSGLVLLAFICQHDLILKQRLILIMKKPKGKKEKE